ncbi:hypothetical protein [Nocardia sp. NBC_01327]|uniref:hypothetical protein n=1 Tax=Nocardia sp. NBC_01327 TaxID=2903593 RepID=UPI002E15EEE9|nr:hypothetical protein OG326_17615 [Nocardia sp. NBC_01327]
MNLQNAVVEGVIVVLVVGWIVYRQTQWQVLDPMRIWRGPIVLGVVGVLQMKTVLAGDTLGGTAVALLVLSAVLSLGVGLAMGAVSQVRWIDGQWQARTGWLGSALWLVLLAVRIGVEVCARSVGAGVVASVGAILLMLALNRAGRGVVLARRAGLSRMVAAD